MKSNNNSITLPPTLLRQAAQVAKSEGRTQNEIVSEAVKSYVARSEFRRLTEFGRQQSKKLGIKPSDIARIIAEYRAEKRSTTR